MSLVIFRFKDYTTYEDFKLLESDVQNWVTKTQLYRAEETIAKCEKAMERLKDLDKVTENINNVKEGLEASIQNCI